MAGAHAAGRDSSNLEHGAIGLREVMFQSITSMAPAGAVALSIAAELAATYAGGALPLSVLLALVGCLLAASSIGQLAKHLPSAGSASTPTRPSPFTRRSGSSSAGATRWSRP